MFERTQNSYYQEDNTKDVKGEFCWSKDSCVGVSRESWQGSWTKARAR